MSQFLFAALYSKCRTVPPTERPLDTCILYRHKEDLPLDGAPFFDIYADEQQPDSFARLWLRDQLPFRAPLLEMPTERTSLSLEHQICLVAAANACDFLAPFESANANTAAARISTVVADDVALPAVSRARRQRRRHALAARAARACRLADRRLARGERAGAVGARRHVRQLPAGAGVGGGPPRRLLDGGAQPARPRDGAVPLPDRPRVARPARAAARAPVGPARHPRGRRRRPDVAERGGRRRRARRAEGRAAVGRGVARRERAQLPRAVHLAAVEGVDVVGRDERRPRQGVHGGARVVRDGVLARRHADPLERALRDAPALPPEDEAARDVLGVRVARRRRSSAVGARQSADDQRRH